MSFEAGNIVQVNELGEMPVIFGQGEIPNYLEIQESDETGTTKTARLYRGEILLVVDDEDANGELVADSAPYRAIPVCLANRIQESLTNAL